jgi:hypothetical protein
MTISQSFKCYIYCKENNTFPVDLCWWCEIKMERFSQMECTCVLDLCFTILHTMWPCVYLLVMQVV